MKKTVLQLLILISITALTACRDYHADPSEAEATSITIKLELNKAYDDTDPFVNEKLFIVTKDVDALTAEGTITLDGEHVKVEVKNNKTKDVLWNREYKGKVMAEDFSLSLKNLKAGDEYVVCMTGTRIERALLELSFASILVQERERPA